MVQVIGQGRTKPLSKSQINAQGFAQAVEKGGQFLQQYQQQKQQKQQMQQENEAVKQNLGIDISGHTDPELRQKLIVEGLKGQQNFKNQSGIEELKGNIQRENFGEKFKQQYGAKYEAQKQMMQDLGLDQPYDYQGQNNSQQNLNQPQEPQQQKEYRPLIPQSKIDKMGQINPQEASRMQRYNDGIREEMRHDQSLSQQKEKFEYQKEKESPEHTRDIELTKYQAQADQKYYNELKERRSKQIFKKESLGRLENLTKKKQTGKAYEKVLEGMGLVSLTSEGRREYSAEAKNQFTDFKAIAGSQLSASEFMILAGAYPNADFSPEANKAIINNLKQVHDSLDKEDEIAERLIKENKGKKPENLQAKVNDELQKYINQKMSKVKDNIKTIMNEQYGIPKGFTLMFDKNGEPLSVPEGEVVQLLESNLADLP
jgi:hypothetical protein